MKLVPGPAFAAVKALLLVVLVCNGCRVIHARGCGGWYGCNSRRQRYNSVVGPSFGLGGFDVRISPVNEWKYNIREQRKQYRKNKQQKNKLYTVTEDPETGSVELTMELPGVLPSDFSVEVEDNKILRIYGSRKTSDDGGITTKKDFVFNEEFRLSDDLDEDKLKVTLSAGILRVQASRRQKNIKSLPVAVITVESKETNTKQQLVSKNESDSKVGGNNEMKQSIRGKDSIVEALSRTMNEAV